MNPKLFAHLVIFISLLGVSYARASPIKVFVSVPPHAFVAERIGSESVEVHTLIDKGQDLHIFEPSSRQVIKLSRAVIFFTAGLQFEKRVLQKVKEINRELIIVDLTEGINLHQVDDGHQLDSHTWLSPSLLATQANNITLELARLAPGKKDEFLHNLTIFTDELKWQEERLKNMFKPYRGRSFFVFHPAFGYFAEAFGLKQVAVEHSGKLPGPRQLSKLIVRARKENVQAIFTQPQFDQRSAKAVASAIGGSVLTLDPMARDVLKNYSDISQKLVTAFQ